VALVLLPPHIFARRPAIMIQNCEESQYGKAANGMTSMSSLIRTVHLVHTALTFGSQLEDGRMDRRTVLTNRVPKKKSKVYFGILECVV
jgi:hypothetical protein